MTLASQMLSDVSTVFLNTDEHAGTYTYTAPRTGTTSSVVGVWELDETPNLEVTRGLENILTGKLMIATGTTVQKDGSFSINSEDWQVESVGAPHVGMRTIVLTRQVTSHRGNGDNFR